MQTMSGRIFPDSIGTGSTAARQKPFEFAVCQLRPAEFCGAQEKKATANSEKHTKFAGNLLHFNIIEPLLNRAYSPDLRLPA